MTQGELGGRMTSPEFAEWLAFENEYGLPDGYFVAGQACATMARLWSSKGEFSPADFVPYFRRSPRKQTVAEQRALMRGLAARGNPNPRV